MELAKLNILYIWDIRPIPTMHTTVRLHYEMTVQTHVANLQKVS